MLLGPYVGRTDEQRCYQEFLTRETPWILVVRGLGGSGKSTLLSLFEKQTPPDTCVVKLDFAQPTFRTDSLTLLREFSDMVKPYCDAQKARDFVKTEMYCRNEIGKRVSSGSMQIGQIEQEVNIGNDANVKEADVMMEVGGTNIQETRCQMRGMATERFYEQIETFTLARLVLILDSCEWLNEETAEMEAARWAAIELAKGLHFRMRNQGRQFFVVLASRLPLQLVGISALEQEHLKLKMLERADVNLYLEDIGVHDPAIQDYIYQMTYGHPHSLSLVRDILEEHWDEPLSMADLPVLQGEFYERALQDVIDRDILKPLLKPPLNLLTQYGVLLHRFNLPLLQAVFKEWLPEPEASDRFKQLVRYPHVESVGNFNYAFHKLLREILAEYIRVQEPEKWRHYHQLALDFLSAKEEISQALRHSADWYYHLLACNEEKGVSYWNTIKTQAPQEYLEALREVAHDTALKLTLATMQCMDIHRDAASNAAQKGGECV